MEAIILAGGFGTRLKHVVGDVPKPMAQVCGDPFLKYIIDDLIKKGITKIVLAVGYKKDIIKNYFKNKYNNVEIVYSVEDTPLLTGGAIKKALVNCNDNNIFIINGDTLFDVDINNMLVTHTSENSDLTIAIKYMENFDRYGALDLENNKIVGFQEKRYTKSGFINGGIYLIKKSILENENRIKFSFEKDFIETNVNKLKIVAYKSDNYFIDIGIPEDYEKAQLEFQKCPVCGAKAKLFRNLHKDGFKKDYNYFICTDCECIFIDSQIIEVIDQGGGLINYSDEYWDMELKSSLNRAFGVSLARMSEVLYYAKIPIKNFIDIGTGPGFFLDAVEKYLPDNSYKFYGVEKYPPKSSNRTNSRNYYICDYKDIGINFDGGMCIEVIEHLTPKMLRELLEDIASVSNIGAIYIFNSGLSEYTQFEDINYIDPFIRGHIMSYTVKSIGYLCKDIGFNVIPIRGKTWAFILEYKSNTDCSEDITNRIWTALTENIEILNDSKMGSVLKILGLESVRAYL